MTFKVSISFAAELDLDEAVEFIARGSKIAAKKWILEFHQKIESLCDMPMRSALIPESEDIGLQLRSLNHYSHRIIYSIDESRNAVNIVRVYHGARNPLNRDNL